METQQASIQAIETLYNGYRFRSRLEARWAVFMDTFGVPYRYEIEGFELGSCRYLPDFWLPEQRTWLEIKPTQPTGAEQDKAILLAQQSGQRVIILYGDPWPGEYEGLIWAGSLADDSFGFDTCYEWCQCCRCRRINLQFSGASNRNCDCTQKHGDTGYDLPWPATEPQPILAAFQRARSFRFAS